jgi:hypothetical protein
MQSPEQSFGPPENTLATGNMEATRLTDQSGLQTTPNYTVTAMSSSSSIPPDIQKIFDSAIDAGPYKLWIGASNVLQPDITSPCMFLQSLLTKHLADESGQGHSTVGGLIPPGYQKSADPLFPWVCPVRSCRKLLPTLTGLGKHFIVS